MLPYLTDDFGNASSLHSHGAEARKAMEKARFEISRAIGAEPEEIVFTSGGTEANNLAVQGICLARAQGGNHIITSAVEHPSVLHTCRFMEKLGFKVTYVPVDPYGRVDPDEVEKRITRKTVLISIMHANNEIGTIQPIREISRIARDKGVPFHTDAIQTLGKIPLEVNSLGLDAASFSGHKVYGPKGSGVLFVRKGLNISPVLFGGGQERGLRSGTENVASIVGMARAVTLARDETPGEMQRQGAIQDRLMSGILEKLEGVKQNGHPTQRLPNHIHLSFSGLDGQKLVLALDRKGIGVSTGSACSSLHPDPSHVLRAIGLSPEQVFGSIRITVGLPTTREDADYVLDTLPPVVADCRRLGVDKGRQEEILRKNILELQARPGGCESVKKMAWAYVLQKMFGKFPGLRGRMK